MVQVAVLIPALNPDQQLVQLIRKLQQVQSDLLAFVVVDDGSDNSHQPVFHKLAQFHEPKLHILHHVQNQGKGAALKTGLNYCLQHFPQIRGIATMDSDGQHTVTALQSCLQQFQKNPQHLVIGTRQFNQKIPFRSRFGNLLTSGLVRTFTHQDISDTQTGLRVIPVAYAQQLVHFPGNHYEFEFDMLLKAKAAGVTVTETPIPTIYLNGNRASHFRVVRDSLAIYSRFLKFSASSLISFFIDIGLFSLIMMLVEVHSLRNILVATIIARSLSAVVNYLINHHLVFGHAGQRTLLKYGCLLVVQMLASGYFTSVVTGVLPDSAGSLTPTIAKIIVDLTLFILSYWVQRDVIFKEGRHVDN